MTFPERFRWANAPAPYNTAPGNPFGFFMIPGRNANGRGLKVLAVDGEENGWEHVSVSIEDSKKCPSWEEMCIVKRLFWPPEACVVQFHPAEADYINRHPGVLHLWSRVDGFP